MWFERLLNVIDSGWIGDAVERRLDLIKRTDPKHIYVENIRSFFSMPRGVAKFFCEVAVREGIFERNTGYLCPKDKNIIAYADAPETTEPIICRICEAQGEDYEFDPSQLQTIEVYSLTTA